MRPIGADPTSNDRVRRCIDVLPNEPKLIGQICDFFRRRTDAPDAFIHAGALTLLSALIGKKISIDFAGKQLTPCLWTVIIGKSSSLRKSTVLELVSTLVYKSTPDGTLNQLPQTCSFEGFFKCMERDIGSDDVRYTGVMIHNEFAVFLQTLKKKYNGGMQETLTDIYDVPHTLTRETLSGGRVTLKRPCVTFLGATTSDWLTTGLEQSDLLSGFVPRFLFISCDHKTRHLDFPDVAWDADGDALVAELAKLHALSGKLGFSHDGKHAYTEYVAERARVGENLVRPELQAFHTRLDTAVLKIAILHAAATRCDTIGSGSIAYACQTADTIRSGLEVTVTEDMAFTRAEKKRQCVVRYLRRAGGSSVHTDVIRASRLSRREFDNVIDTLVSSGLIGVRNAYGVGAARYYDLLCMTREASGKAIQNS